MLHRAVFSEWLAIWYGLGGRPGSPALFEQLRRAYGEKHRAYHTLAHIEACLALLDDVRHLAKRPGEIAVALWFHDAVYDPHATDNEERSAEWAARALSEHEVAQDIVDRVQGMILATCHRAAANDGDTFLLLDIDLAILGADPSVFDRYEEEIREEYAWVPDDRYREARTRVLRSFLSRDVIYRCPALRERFEAHARANLLRSISRLVADGRHSTFRLADT